MKKKGIGLKLHLANDLDQGMVHRGATACALLQRRRVDGPCGSAYFRSDTDDLKAFDTVFDVPEALWIAAGPFEIFVVDIGV